uniref:BTB domain-containing protein n=1 Tax=Panagrolaimus sp. ES5 TaxID=591445 RepID=A0AC34FKY6_9BILA
MQENLNLIVNAKIICKSANFVDYWTHIYQKSDSYGAKFCLSEELFDPEKKFIVENQICISFEATLSIFDVNDFPFKKAKIQTSLGPILWENKNGKDAKIVVGGKDIKVHKCVIESRSTIFKNLCKNICKIEPGVSTLSPKDLINIALIMNYKFDVVQKAVLFCYDISCFGNLTAENAVDLLNFAKEFQMNDLKEKMEEFCVKTLSVSNACLFANASISTMSEKVYQKCFEFLLKCMKDGTSVKDIEKVNEDMQKELFVKAFSPS